MQASIDPLQVLFSSAAPEPGSIARITSGSKYILTELISGHRGVAGSPGPEHSPVSAPPAIWDLQDPTHRQLLTAYYNAVLNEANAKYDEKGPEDWIRGGGWKECIMIGFFRPLYFRLVSQGIRVFPFDLEKEDAELHAQRDLLPTLGKVRQVIATPLIFINRTWEDIFREVTTAHDILLTGPSCTCHQAYATLPGVKAIFGSTILPGDDALHEIVAAGGGMQEFKHLVRKSVCHLGE